MRSGHQDSFRDGTTPPHGRCPSSGGNSSYLSEESMAKLTEPDATTIEQVALAITA